MPLVIRLQIRKNHLADYYERQFSKPRKGKGEQCCGNANQDRNGRNGNDPFGGNRPEQVFSNAGMAVMQMIVQQAGDIAQTEAKRIASRHKKSDYSSHVHGRRHCSLRMKHQYAPSQD